MWAHMLALPEDSASQKITAASAYSAIERLRIGPARLPSRSQSAGTPTVLIPFASAHRFPAMSAP